MKRRKTKLQDDYEHIRFLKALLDPCNGIIFEDDEQVVEIVAVKERGEPRAEVTFAEG